MKKPTVSAYIKEKTSAARKQEGPFVTISRQYGCCGYEIASMLAAKLKELNDEANWQIHGNNMLQELADETGFRLEAIEKARTEKTGFIREILKNVRSNAEPDAFQVRNQIAIKVRRVALQGCAIIIGQGSAAATSDMKNGLNIRIEAPLEWRVLQVCRRKNISREQAWKIIQEVEQQRKYIRKCYSEVNTRHPAFHLMLDSSKFTAEQITEQIILAMQHCGMIS